MSDEVIRYGAGGVPYVKKSPAPKKEEVKEEVISEILTKNPNKKEDKEERKEEERGIKKESHDYFGGGPFSGPKSDLAASVLRIAEKAAKDKEAEEEVKGFEKMSNDKLNQSVKDAYLDKVRGGM